MKYFKTKKRPSKDIPRNVIAKIQKEHDLKLWRKVFHMASDPVWYMAVIALSYISIMMHLFHSVDGACKSLDSNTIIFLYIMDVFYMFDVILTTASKYLPNLDLPENNLSMRPIGILVLETLSLVPVEMLTNEKRMFCILRTNRSIRIARVMHYFFKSRNLINASLIVRIIEMFSSIVFIVMVFFSFYCNVECYDSYCNSTHICVNKQAILMFVSKASTSGFSIYPAQHFRWELMSTVAEILSFFMVYTITMCYLMVTIIYSTRHRDTYIDRYNVTMMLHETFNTPKYLRSSTLESFNATWHKGGGYNDNYSFLQTLPLAMRNEITVDICWNSFQHSQLFKAMDLPFLRYISTFVKQEIMLPGECVYTKNDVKDKMVYVVYGSLQLLSEEDGESPIMTFTSGTCLGESSLMCSCSSPISVCCKTLCELHVLSREDFARAMCVFPEACAKMHSLVRERIKNAQETKAVADVAKRKVYHGYRKIDTFTIFWIKNVLHKMMSIDPDSKYRHELQNIYLLYDADVTDFDELVFCADFLNMYVIGERIEADIDTVFVKATFPCILQPTSFAVYLWETIIVIVTVIASFLIPYAAFVANDKLPWFDAEVITTTIIFWFDVYMQLSIATKTRTSISTKFSTIINAKMESLGFWLDMFSCLPCEIFSTFVLDNVTDQTFAALHLNRVAKLWRIERLFRLWERQFKANIVLIRYVKFSWVFLYTVFVVFCALFFAYPQFHRMLAFLSVQVTTCTGIIFHPFDPNDALFGMLDVACTFINMSMYAHIGSGFVMTSLNKLTLQHFCSDLLIKIASIDAKKQYSRRLVEYINVQWWTNECEAMKEKTPYLGNASSGAHRETMEFIAHDLIRTIQFFDGLSDELISDVCVSLKTLVLPPNEFLTYAGDLHNEIYVLQQGTCELFQQNRRTFISTSHSINLLEVLFRTPSAVYCVTKTHCRFFVIKRKSLVKTLTHFDEMTAVNDAITRSSDVRGELMLMSKQISVTLSSFAQEKKRSFVDFNYGIKAHSYEEYDYFIPFDRLYPFGCVRFFLLRTTIIPDGKFIFVWECFRCFFALMAMLLAFTFPLLQSKYRNVLYFLDFTAAVDILFRLHVCYYNDDGVLIKHPTSTALHYLTHGFLVDFLGMLPLGVLVYTQDYIVYFTATAFKLLQFHRYYQFMRFLQATAYLSNKKTYGVIFIPPMLILCNFCGSLLINMECDFTLGGDLICKNDSMIASSPLVRPVSSLRGHLYGMYAVACVLTKTGWQGFETKTTTATNFITFLTMMGLFISTSLVGMILTLSSHRRGRHLEYQEAMRSLKHFMRTMSVSYELRKNIIDSFEKKWKTLEGESIYYLSEPFHKSLRLDILYEFFGHKIYQSSMLQHKTKTFYRNLLPHLQLDHIYKGGYAETINDVSRHMCIILSGKADVIAPDGTHVAVLYPGSIFGNMENAARSRMRVSVVAVSHVEILRIKSTTFHKMLRSDSEIMNDYFALKTRYLSYVPARAVEEVASAKQDFENTIFHATLDPNSKRTRYWGMFNVLFSCYFGVLLDFYQLGSTEFGTLIITLQYASDLMYALLWLMQDRMAYEDESGNLITDIAMIKKRRRKNKFTYWISVVSLLPFDIPILMLDIDEDVQGKLFALTRLNRILRLDYTFEFFRSNSKKLNVNIYILRFSNVVLLMSLILSAIASLLGILACSLELNIHPNVPSCNDIHRSSSVDKFKFYIRFLYLVTDSICLTGQSSYYPQGEVLIIAFIAIILVGQNLFAISISQIFGILVETNNTLFTFRGVVDRILYFMRRGGVSASLIERASNYLQSLWAEQRGIAFPGLLKEAPGYLQDAVMNDAFSHLIIDHPIFADCHVDCLRQIVQQMRTTMYFQGDYVQFKGTIDMSMYFIFEGEIVVLKDDFLEEESVVNVLKGGDSFGVLQGLFRRNCHKYTYRATTRTMLAHLNFDTWEYLLNFFPASKESIYKAAESYGGV